jgi:hypothetical protein
MGKLLQEAGIAMFYGRAVIHKSPTHVMGFLTAAAGAAESQHPDRVGILRPAQVIRGQVYTFHKKYSS